MITIGLVGGVASGKSAVADAFSKLGAGVLDGDRIGHEVLGLSSVREKLVARWGDMILDGEKIDRSVLAKLVFDETNKAAAKNLKFLESVTHPEIGRKLSQRVEKMRELTRFPVCIIDAAVMIKAGWDELCDEIIFVDSPEALRRKRAELRGMSAKQFDSREAMQTPISEKKKKAGIVIDNSGPPQSTFIQVEEVWQSLLQKT